MEVEIVDVARDLPRHRTWTTKTNKIHFEQTDPYGFWKVHLDKGQLPRNIQDAQFTSYDEARKAVVRYLESKGTKIQEAI